jgi:hypothetical protein
MIHTDQLLPLYLQACPDFEWTWQRYLTRWQGDASRHYVNAGLFAHYLAVVNEHNSSVELSAASQLVEQLLADGSTEVKRIATTGIVGTLKQIAAQPTKEPTTFKKWLGPQAQALWELNDQGPQTLTQDEYLLSSKDCPPAGLMTSGLIAIGIMVALWWSWGLPMEIWSIATLLAAWLGISIGERIQQGQQNTYLRMLDEQAQGRGLPYTPEMNAAIRQILHGQVVVPWHWKLMQGTFALAFMLGFPLTFSTVLGNKFSPFLFTGAFLLSVVTGVAAAWAFVLWFRPLLEARFATSQSEP